MLDFALRPDLEAHEPPEARGLARDQVRMLVARLGSGEISHHRFLDLPDLLAPGDLLLVNTSATIPAALSISDGSGLVVHLSTELPDGAWLVELRKPRGGATAPYSGGEPGQIYAIDGGGTVRLREQYSLGRLWVATIDTGRQSVAEYLLRHGRPIRYAYVGHDWPLEAYRSVFSVDPGSAEMPSASRPFTDAVVTQLVTRGILLAPVILHTGVASPESHERPYPERYSVPEATARIVNTTRAAGGHVIAVGTTPVRAIESVADSGGRVEAGSGWTDLVITQERGVRAVDGLLTGFHEPKASHLQMLAAFAGHDLLQRCYRSAIDAGYLWHEFGDVNLLLP